jgi:hypothetical protein
VVGGMREHFVQMSECNGCEEAGIVQGIRRYRDKNDEPNEQLTARLNEPEAAF